MLNGLTLRGYRSFDAYRMTGLARVNLVVGKNNCGKTSILEAIELLVSGDPSALRESSVWCNELTGHGADISQPVLRACIRTRIALRVAVPR